MDIWASGVLLYALITGNFPFRASSDKELYKQILKCNYVVPEYVSLSAKHLIAKMLCSDPQKRPKASELLKDPWFRASSACSITSAIIFKTDDQQEKNVRLNHDPDILKNLSNSSNSLDLHIYNH